MAILYVGIDLAKNVFAIHGVNEHGKAMLMCRAPSAWKRALGAHHGARLLAQNGPAVRLMAAKSSRVTG